MDDDGIFQRRVGCLIGLIALCCSLLACGGDDREPVADDSQPAKHSLVAVRQFYADHPDLFSFKTIDDLPEDLDWQDGGELPEIGSPDARKGGTFNVAMRDFPRTLRLFGPDANSHFRSYLLDETALYLGRIHPTTRTIYPQLAEQWAVSPERKTVYVRLHPDARFSDGERLTSDDFLYSLYFFRSPHIRAPWMSNFYSSLFTNITRYDEQTFSMTARAATPDFHHWIMTFIPTAEHFFGDLDEDFVQAYQWTFWPSTSAYRIRPEDVLKGRSITLTRIQDWWARDRKFLRHRFNPDKIRITVIRDRAKTLEAFRIGDVDQIHIDTTQEWYEKFPDSDPLITAGYVHKAQFHNQFPVAVNGLFINSHQPYLNNRDLRLGIQYASHFQLIIDKLFRGDNRRLRTLYDGYAPFSHPTLQARPFDPVKAREHFSAAGFDRPGADGVLRNAAGDRLSFTVTYGKRGDDETMTLLRQEALKAGLELRLERLDQTASWKKVSEKKHQIQFTGFTNPLEMYPRYWEGAHSSNAYDKAFLEDGSINPERKPKPQTNNFELIAVPELDRLIDTYNTSESAEQMIELARRMDEIIYDYAAFVPGETRDFYRSAHWRWVRFPEGFNYKYTRSATNAWVHWIDSEVKARTMDARSANSTFAPHVRIYDQFRTP